jgi:hypothetical protein
LVFQHLAARRLSRGIEIVRGIPVLGRKPENLAVSERTKIKSVGVMAPMRSECPRAGKNCHSPPGRGSLDYRSLASQDPGNIRFQINLRNDLQSSANWMDLGVPHRESLRVFIVTCEGRDKAKRCGRKERESCKAAFNILISATDGAIRIADNSL